MVTRTDCYHYFHVACLARYMNFMGRQQQQEEQVGYSVAAEAAAIGSSHYQTKQVRESTMCSVVIIQSVFTKGQPILPKKCRGRNKLF